MSRFTADVSPDFISASSPSELRRLLFLNQKALGGEVKYLSIQFDGKQWVAWFFNRLEEMAITEAVAKVKNKGSN
jgi:hypothetical protein